MKLKQIVCCLLLTSTSFMFVGCGNGSGSSTATQLNQDEKLKKYSPQMIAHLNSLPQQVRNFRLSSDDIVDLTKICVVNGSLSNIRTTTIDGKYGEESKPKTLNKLVALMPGQISCNYLNGQKGFTVYSDYKNQSIKYNFQTAHPDDSVSYLQIFLMLFTNMAEMAISAIAFDSFAFGILSSSQFVSQILPIGLLNPSGELVQFGLLAFNSNIPMSYQAWADMGLMILLSAADAGGNMSGVSAADWKDFARDLAPDVLDQLVEASNTQFGSLDNFVAALNDEASNYQKSLSSENTSLDVISGQLVPGNSPAENDHIFVLGLAQETSKIAPGVNPLSWVPIASAEGVSGLFDPDSCIDKLTASPNFMSQIGDLLGNCSYKLQIFTMNLHSQIINQTWYKPDQPNSVTLASIPQDGVYICLTDDTNGTTNNCSMNDLSAPLDYSDPISDDSGKPYMGTIRVTNNTAYPITPILMLYNKTTTDGYETSISGNMIPPNNSYRFNANQIPNDIVGYKIALNSSVWPGSPNFFIAGGFNAYNSSWAEQRAVINYNFASPLISGLSVEGPYQAYNYSTAQLSDPNGDLWKNHGVRAWQQIQQAQILTTTNNANDGAPRIEAWVPNWNGLTFSAINDIDLRADDIMFAFANVDPTGNVTSSNPWGDFAQQSNGLQGNGLMASLLALGKPVYLGVGGWNNSDNFTAAIRNSGATIPASISALIDRFNIDASGMGVTQKISGVNLDWEPNNGHWTVGATSDPKTVTYQDLQNFINIIDGLNKQDIKVSVSIPQNIAILKNVDDLWKSNGNTEGFWHTLADKTQSIKPMTYDYHAATWDGPDNKAGYTNFNEPLTFSPNQADITDFASFNVESSMNYFLNDGIPASKLTMGQATYGYAFPLITGQFGPYSKFDNNLINSVIGLEIPNSSIISYKTIYYNMISNKLWFDIHSPNSFGVDPNAQEAFTYGKLGDTTIWVPFENHNTAMAKMQYAKSQFFYSVMVWEIDQDLPAPLWKVKTPESDSIISGLIDGRNNQP